MVLQISCLIYIKKWVMNYGIFEKIRWKYKRRTWVCSKLEITLHESQGDNWTSSISAMDLLDLATKMKNTMTEEEFKSVYKITKY